MKITVVVFLWGFLFICLFSWSPNMYPYLVNLSLYSVNNNLQLTLGMWVYVYNEYVPVYIFIIYAIMCIYIKIEWNQNVRYYSLYFKCLFRYCLLHILYYIYVWLL